VGRLAREEVIAKREIARLRRKKLFDVDIPLFFLLSEGRVSLWQEEFFGKIFAQVSRAEE